MLAAKTSGAAAAKYGAIVDILTGNKDGMYVLSEPYPPESALLGSSAKTVPAGPASLATPLVLEAALREKAKGEDQVRPRHHGRRHQTQADRSRRVR